jgi:hypothetical protein
MGTLTVSVGDEALLVNRMNIAKEEARIQVAEKLAEGRPGIEVNHVLDELLKLAATGIGPAPGRNGDEAGSAPRPDANYQSVGGCICREGPTFGGPVLVALCNFDARIVEQVVHDDGAEQSRRLRLEGSLASGESLPAIEVGMEEFARGDWPLLRWGSEAVVLAGPGNKDHLRAAVQLLSGRVSERTVHTVTGWREINSDWAYLHAGGAIGPVGPHQSVSVFLPDALMNFRLPDPPTGDALIAAVRASIDVTRELAPDRVILPLLATTYRAVLPGATFSTHASGRTGSGKTELAALMQQHFGPAMDAKNLPANWSSTANALEATAFAAKDALLVVDDFCPTGSQADVARHHKDADRLFRAQGNRSGRQRLRPDGNLKPAKPPRGVILSTGEDVPRGHSLQARLIVVAVGADDVNFGRLNECQCAASSGLYAQAIAGFVRWIAPKFEQIVQRLKLDVQRLRDQIAAGLGHDRHRRTPVNVADLIVGFALFLEFAQEIGAITPEVAGELQGRCQRALLHVGAEQSSHHGSSDPAQRFLCLLAAALSSGRAHIAGMDGGCPSGSAQRWGWRLREGAERFPGESHPLGKCIGWTDGENVFLEPEASFAEVQRLAGEQGETLPVSQTTLYKRLREQHLLASVDSERGRLRVRVTIAGDRRTVLHLRAEHVLLRSESGPIGPGGPEDEKHAENGPPDRAGPLPAAENRPTPTAQDSEENRTAGPIGPIGSLPRSSNAPAQNKHGGQEEVVRWKS